MPAAPRRRRPIRGPSSWGLAVGLHPSESPSSPTGFPSLILLTAAARPPRRSRLRGSAGSTTRNSPGSIAVYQILAAGVALAFLTGDLFTLFVAFEIMLTASYVLLTHRAGGTDTRSTLSYVVIGLVASRCCSRRLPCCTPVTGTVNMADLAGPPRRGARRDSQRPRLDAVSRLRHQGGDLPAVLLAAGLVPGRPDARHRVVRRTPHEDRCLRHPADPDAAVSERRAGGADACSSRV